MVRSRKRGGGGDGPWAPVEGYACARARCRLAEPDGFGVPFGKNFDLLVVGAVSVPGPPFPIPYSLLSGRVARSRGVPGQTVRRPAARSAKSGRTSRNADHVPSD